MHATGPPKPLLRPWPPMLAKIPEEHLGALFRKCYLDSEVTAHWQLPAQAEEVGPQV